MLSLSNTRTQLPGAAPLATVGLGVAAAKATTLTKMIYEKPDLADKLGAPTWAFWDTVSSPPRARSSGSWGRTCLPLMVAVEHGEDVLEDPGADVNVKLVATSE